MRNASTLTGGSVFYFKKTLFFIIFPYIHIGNWIKSHERKNDSSNHHCGTSISVDHLVFYRWYILHRGICSMYLYSTSLQLFFNQKDKITCHSITESQLFFCISTAIKFLVIYITRFIYRVFLSCFQFKKTVILWFCDTLCITIFMHIFAYLYTRRNVLKIRLH